MVPDKLKDCTRDTEVYSSESVRKQIPAAGQRRAETEYCENRNRTQ